MSPRTWAARSGVPAIWAEAPVTRFAGLALRWPTEGSVTGTGLGVAGAVMVGKTPDAPGVPAGVLPTPLRFPVGPTEGSVAEGETSGKRLGTFPARVGVLPAPSWAGTGAVGRVGPGPDVPVGPAPVDEAPADGVGDEKGVVLGLVVVVVVGIVLGLVVVLDVGLGVVVDVGVVLGLGVAVGVGVVLGLGVAVGVGVAEQVVLGLGDGVEVALGLAVSADADGGGEGDAGVLEGVGQAGLHGDWAWDVALHAGVTPFASAGSRALAASPKLRRPTVIRPTAIAVTCPRCR